MSVLDVREQWCQPGEPILWCMRSDLKFKFDVPGLDLEGKPPQAGSASKEKEGVGALGFALVAAAVVLGGDGDGNSDSGPSKPSPPSRIVSGSGPGCFAVNAVRHLANADPYGFWVLTPARLARLVVKRDEPETPPAEEKPAAPEEKPSDESWLDGAKRLGIGALGFGRKPATEPAESEPESVKPPEPAPKPKLPPLRVHEEWVVPRQAITGIEAHRRKLGRDFSPSKAWYLRIGFTDGSAFEFGGRRDDQWANRLAAMTRGER